MDTSKCVLYGTCLKRSDTFIYLGMTFGVDGILPLAHAQRMASKTVDAVNLLRAVGMNGFGFAISVRKRLYETFVRPKLEYGLQIMEPCGEVFNVLRKAQLYALRVMFSVGRNTSEAALHALSGIVSIAQRCCELNAGWMTRVSRLGKGFMVREAHIAHQRRRLPKSTFCVAEKNKMVQEYRKETIWSGAGRPSEEENIRILRRIRTKCRKADRSDLWTKKPTQVGQIDRKPTVTSLLIDMLIGQRSRRLITLWVLKKLIGKPKDCLNCNGASKTSREHVQTCLDVYPTTHLNMRRPVEALKAVLQISRRCLGFSQMDPDIRLEEAGERQRELERQARLAGHLDKSGGNCYWRYFAPAQAEVREVPTH